MSDDEVIILEDSDEEDVEFIDECSLIAVSDSD